MRRAAKTGARAAARRAIADAGRWRNIATGNWVEWGYVEAAAVLEVGDKDEVTSGLVRLGASRPLERGAKATRNAR